jgi:hypothetical protein
MKKLSILLLTLLVTSAMMLAQEEIPEKEKRKKRYSNDEIQTLFGRQRSYGGYGAFWVGYSIVDDKHALQFGGRGSWIIQHSFAIGFGGTGFINEYHYDAILDKEVFLTGGYGGMYLEPIVLPKLPIHLAFPVMIGAGGVSFVSYEDATWNSNFVEDYEVFLMVEPGAEVELNLTRFMRLGIGATYRIPFSFNVGQSGAGTASANSIKGLTYNVTFKFGSF